MIVLTIAGSDSGGGAGIQADLKTFAALKCFGTSVITAITAQNTQGVFAVAPAPLIEEQLAAVLSDFELDAIKIGMLWDASTIEMVMEMLPRDVPVVVDPVMLAKGGAPLLKPEALLALKKLFSKATLITPNLPEASLLLNRPVEQMESAARELLSLCNAVLLKGGHLQEPGSDCLCTQSATRWYIKPPIATKNTHGTGCTFSAAIAAHLAWGLPLEEAVAKAKDYLHSCLESSWSRRIGKGIGPVCPY